MTDVDGALKAKQMKTQIDEYLKVNGNNLYRCVLYVIIVGGNTDLISLKSHKPQAVSLIIYRDRHCIDYKQLTRA